MSLKKFLVNARTKILEFKKKHNLLVEKVKNVEDEIPTIANSLIQDDKNILSKIIRTYNEEGNYTMFTFPKEIVLLKLYMQLPSDGYPKNYFFGSSFQGHKVKLTEENIAISDTNYLEVGDELIKLIIPGNMQLSNINSITYINASGNTKQYYTNTYYILKPITSGGTKLYRHTFDFGYGESNFISVISTRPQPYNNPDQFKENYISAFSGEHPLLELFKDNVNGYTAYYVFSGSITSETYGDGTDFTDTVTEL